VPNRAGDYRARLKYGLGLWTRLVYAKEPSGICPRCLARKWHDAAHCFAKGPYRSLCLEPDNGAPLCRPCHRRVDCDHHAKEQFFTAYMGPDKYERLRLLAMTRSKMDLGLSILALEADVASLPKEGRWRCITCRAWWTRWTTPPCGPK
jgi:hypothetical protein